VDPGEHEELTGELLLPLSPDFRSTGSFRIVLFGKESHVKINIAIEKVFSPLPVNLMGITLVAAFDLSDILPRQNAFSTEWWDVLELIRKKTIQILDKDKTPTDPEPVIKYLTDEASRKANIGASLRWALAATESRELLYELQALPVPPKLLNKQNLKTDNVVSVLLCPIHLDMEVFPDDGRAPLGPLPRLFTEDRSGLRDYLQSDCIGLLEDICAINNKILIMEHLSVLEAVTYLQSRHRAAKGSPAFATATGQRLAPPPKRSRLSSASSSSSSAGNARKFYKCKFAVCVKV
jgi:hypothetical protein